MSTVTINIKTDEEVESKAQEICKNRGMDLSTVINAFIVKMIDSNDIPTDLPIKSKRPNMFGCMKGKVWMSDDFDEPQ